MRARPLRMLWLNDFWRGKHGLPGRAVVLVVLEVLAELVVLVAEEVGLLVLVDLPLNDCAVLEFRSSPMSGDGKGLGLTRMRCAAKLTTANKKTTKMCSWVSTYIVFFLHRSNTCKIQRKHAKELISSLIITTWTLKRRRSFIRKEAALFSHAVAVNANHFWIIDLIAFLETFPTLCSLTVVFQKTVLPAKGFATAPQRASPKRATTSENLLVMLCLLVPGFVTLLCKTLAASLNPAREGFLASVGALMIPEDGAPCKVPMANLALMHSLRLGNFRW
jgi:hypothetical protein